MLAPVNVLKLNGHGDVHLTKSEREAVSRFSLKKVKENEDRNGAPVFSFSVYLDNKLVAEESCELYGEEPKNDFSKKGEAMLDAFLSENKSLVEKMAIASNRESSCTHSMFKVIKDVAFFLWGQRSVFKKTDKKLIMGDYDDARFIGWGSYTLEETFAMNKGPASIKKAFQKMLDEAKPGYVFYNTHEQLESLGLGEFIGKHPALPV